MLNEEQIETRVQRYFDRIDPLFMDGHMTQAEYDQKVREINQWADDQFDLIARTK